MKTKVYTIGSFSGWRDEIEGKLSGDYKHDDPRNHSQSSIARLDWEDMNSAMNCPVSLIYIPKGKRAGTMSYAELGASWARGNCIISVDGNDEKDNLLRGIASYSFENFGDAIQHLNNLSSYEGERLNTKDRTESHERCKHVMFVGDYHSGLLTKLAETGKNSLVNPDFDYFENVHEQVDLIVADFEKGHNSRGLFYMGVGYALEIPTILVEGNNVPYPPLLGLSRRVMVGDKRHEQLEFYLENLESQHISDEAMVYYDLMKKFD